MCSAIKEKSWMHQKKSTREDTDASGNTNAHTHTNYTQCSPGSSWVAGLYLGGGKSW